MNMEYACDLEIGQNSNHSVSLEFRLEISSTCQNPEMVHFFTGVLDDSCEMTAFNDLLSHLNYRPVADAKRLSYSSTPGL